MTYPISYDNQRQIVDAVNYLASGPVVAARTTEGFTTDQASYVTGNFRAPWTRSTAAGGLYTIVSIATTTWLDANTIQFDFAAAQPSPPFQLGNNLTVSGVTPSGYDGFYAGDGVVQCTTTYVIIRTRTPQPNYGPGTGGTLTFDAFDPNLAPTTVSTDCNAKITVDYGSTQINLNAQIKNIIQYDTQNNAQALYRVEINRYKGFPSNDPVNPGFYFQYDKTITQREYLLDLAATLTNATSLTIDPAPPAPYTNTRTAAALTYPETYFVVNVATLTGVGQLMRVNVKIAAGFPAVAGDPYLAANTTVTIVEGGEGYQAGDLVLIDGADIGGVSGVDDLVLIVSTVGNTNPNFIEYETVFSGVKDTNPPVGYYWYILDLYVETLAGSGPLYILGCELGQRSLTAQVLKQ